MQAVDNLLNDRTIILLNLLNDRTIILLNFVEYHLILAHSACGSIDLRSGYILHKLFLQNENVSNL